MNKKADIAQLPVVLVIVFIAAIIGFLFLVMSNNVNNFWQSSGLLNSSDAAKTSITTIQSTSAPTTDWMIFLLFLGSNLGLVISAVRTKFSPTLIFFFILLLMITVLIASGMVNIYKGFAIGDTATASQLVLTNFVFSKYTPLIMCIIGLMIMIIMWGKSGGDIVT